MRLDESTRAVEVLRAQIAFFSRDSRDAPRLLLSAAAGAWKPRARRRPATSISTRWRRVCSSEYSPTRSVSARSPAARTAPPSSDRAADLLLDSYVAARDRWVRGRCAIPAPGADGLATDEVSMAGALRWLWLASHAAHDVWDDESWDVLSTRHLLLARQAGALAVLPIALSTRIGSHLFAGELAEAAALVDEFAMVNEVMDNHLPAYGALALAAWRGRQDTVSELVRTYVPVATARGEGMGLSIIDYSSAVLHNSLGQYQEAMAAAERGAGYPQELGFATWSLVELVEAAARSGHPDRAADGLRAADAKDQRERHRLGAGHRSPKSPHLSQGDAAESSYTEAVERLGRTRIRVELARAHLFYGEWLRREGRRLDARHHVRSAYEMFADMGAEAFAERARHELLATGETVRKRAVGGRDEFTAQEARIARLAAEGRTNPEIGAELFLSPRTVEWHLRKVFAKLGIGSRRELPDAPAGSGAQLALA